MPVGFIEYKGRQILYVDLRKENTQEKALRALDEMVQAFKDTDEKLLVLSNIEGAFVGPEVIEKTKQRAKEIFNPQSKKRAMVGVKGLKKIIINGYMSIMGGKLRVFDTEEQAKEYLIAQ